LPSISSISVERNCKALFFFFENEYKISFIKRVENSNRLLQKHTRPEYRNVDGKKKLRKSHSHTLVISL
jgi:hypothetical protein